MTVSVRERTGRAAMMTRHGLLRGVSVATLSLVVTSVLHGEAQAQSTTSLCTAPSGTSPTVTCGPGTTTGGLSFSPTSFASFRVNVVSGTTVNNTTNTATVDALNISAGTTSVTIDAPSGTAFRASSTGNDGIYLPATAGGVVTFGGLIVSEIDHGIHVEASATGAANLVSISNAATGQVYSYSTGLLGNSANGDVTIDNQGSVSQGAATVTASQFGGTITIPSLSSTGNAAIAASTRGTGAITVSNSGTLKADSDGIRAVNGGVGAVTVTNGGTITAGGLYGIYGNATASASAGMTLVNAAAGSVTSPNIGIQGSTNAAPLTISNAGSISSGYAGLVGGNVSGALTVGNTGTIAFGRFGMLTGSALGVGTITNSGSLTQTGTASTSTAATLGLPPAIAANVPATGSWGIYAVGGVAPLTLLNDTAGTITADTGLEGRLFGSAQASRFNLTGPFPATNGPLTIENRGTVTATADGLVGRGIGPGPISLTNSGTVSAGNRGLYAATQTTSDVTIVNSGSVSGATGVLVNHLSSTGDSSGAVVASGATQVTNAVNGRIQGSDTAVDVVTYNGPVTIQNAGTIAGGDRGITAGNNFSYRDATRIPSSFTRASSTLTIENLAGATLGATSDQALRANWTGPVTVNNAGTITGYVAFGPNSSAPSAPGGVTGTVAFNNSGTFVARGNSSFNNGTDAVFNNSGTVALAPATAPTNVVFNGLSTFRNSGTINLVNGVAGDSLTINGNYVGQNGRLLTEFSTQDKLGDRLVINGNATGTTGITVTNLTGATPFTTGAPVVVVNGTTDASAFTLTNTRGFGTLEPVLVSTQQGNSTTTGIGVAVAAVPNAAALSGPTAVIASRTIAFQGGTAVNDRMTQLRTEAQRSASGTPSIPQALQYAGLNQYAALVSKDPIAPNLVQPVEPPPSNVRPAVWARAYGDLERRTGSTSFSFGGNSFYRDLGYSQSGGGLLGGVDLVISRLTSAEDGLVIGVMGGYTTATVNLNQAAGRQDYEGGTVGVYGSYLNGPWFWDHLFKVDLLGLDIRVPGMLQRTGLQNYAYTTNVGYRIPLQNGAYVEPTAGLEYVATSFNQQAALTATSVPLRDGDALRGRIGARVGTEFIEGGIRVEPSVTGYLYSVLTESGVSGAVNGITGATGLREQGKLRGEVQASVNFFNLKTGLSGFVRADYRIGGDLVGGGGRVGMRYQW